MMALINHRRAALLVLVVFAAACPPSLAYGASLTGTNRELAAGFHAVGTCGTLSNARVGWTVRNNNAVLAAEVSGLPTACNGHPASITLSGSGGTSLTGQTGVVIAGGSAVFSGLTGTPPDPANVVMTHFVINGVPRNFIEEASAGLESGVGRWQSWYNATPSASSVTAKSGTNSLRVDITGSPNWGISSNNWPGYAATAGAHRMSFWTRLGSGSGLAVELVVDWFDSSNTKLQTDRVRLTGLTTTWQQASLDVVAPPGTTKVFPKFVDTTGVAGDYLFIDDIFVGTRN